MQPAPRRPWTLTDRPGWRLLALCGLYFAQGLPYGFMFITLSAVLADAEWTPGEIGSLLAMATLPWAFKWAAGPVIDRFGMAAMGRRRPWILLAEAGMVVSLILLALGPDPLHHDRWLAWALLAMSACSALQDVAVDALAVDLLREDERGRVNGFMYGSSYMGNALGGAGMGTVVAMFDLRIGFLVIAVVVSLVMLLPLFLRERKGERLLPWTAGEAVPGAPVPAKSMRIVLWRLGRAFSLRSTIALAVVALLVSIPGGFLTGFSNVLIVEELGWGSEKLATWTGIATWAGLAGSILGGLLADQIGPRRLILLTGCGLSLSYLLFADAPGLWSSDVFIVGLMVFDALVSGALFVSIFSLCMKVSWPLVAATQFTAYMAMLNLSRTMGQWLTAQLEGAVSYQGAYALAAAMQLAPLAVLLIIDSGQARRVLGGDAPSR
ncbi:MAG: MFS transporter [Phycisphaerales bacterium]|jgi:PAT family beta-lactamase induction signal transducer AmpG|nr:MFS transporter [Phycisphaerales bacterium]